MIETDLREVDIDFNLSVNYTTTTNLAEGAIEDELASTDVSSSVDACQCAKNDANVTCINDSLPPNSEISVCAFSIDQAMDVDQLESMVSKNISHSHQLPNRKI